MKREYVLRLTDHGHIHLEIRDQLTGERMDSYTRSAGEMTAMLDDILFKLIEDTDAYEVRQLEDHREEAPCD